MLLTSPDGESRAAFLQSKRKLAKLLAYLHLSLQGRLLTIRRPGAHKQYSLKLQTHVKLDFGRSHGQEMPAILSTRPPDK